MSVAPVDRHLGALRCKIDVLDSQIAELLERRMVLSFQVQALKIERGSAVEDPEREAEIPRRLLLAGRSPEASAWVALLPSLCREAFARRASATSPPAPAGSLTPA